MKDTALYWWCWNRWYHLTHPREALCDWGIWKCPTHPRMLYEGSPDRRWALRRKLRARRIRSWGWGRTWSAEELASLKSSRPTEEQRAEWARKRAAFLVFYSGPNVPPWQQKLIGDALDRGRLR